MPRMNRAAFALSGLGAAYQGNSGNALAQADREIANLLAPYSDVIDHLPNPPDYPSFTREVKVTPIEAILSMLDPLRHFLIDIVEQATLISGRKIRYVGLPGQPQIAIQMRFEPDTSLIAGYGARGRIPMGALYQAIPGGKTVSAPPTETKSTGVAVAVAPRSGAASDLYDMQRLGIAWPRDLSASGPTAQLIIRMKAALEFMVLGYQDPVALAKGVGQTLVMYTQRGLITLAQQASFAQALIEQAVSQFNVPLAGLVNPPEGKFLRAMVAELQSIMPSLQIFQDARAAVDAAAARAREVAKKAQEDADKARAEADRQRQAAQDTGTKVVETAKKWFSGFGAIPAVSLMDSVAAATTAAATAKAAYASAKQSQAHVLVANTAKPSPSAVAKANELVKRTAAATVVADKALKVVEAAKVAAGNNPNMIQAPIAAKAMKEAAKATSASDAAVANANVAVQVAKMLPTVKAVEKTVPLPLGIDVTLKTLTPVALHDLPTPSLIAKELPKSSLPLPEVPQKAAQAVQALQKAVELHVMEKRRPGVVPKATLQRATNLAQQAAVALTQSAPVIVEDFDLDSLCNSSRNPDDLWRLWMAKHGHSIMGLGAAPAAAAAPAGAAVTSTSAATLATGATAAEATAPATTPAWGALLVALVDYISKHPELVDQSLDLVGKGGEVVQKIIDEATKGDKLPGVKPKPPKKEGGGAIPFLVGGAVGLVTLPVLGPAAAAAAGAASAFAANALGKKEEPKPRVPVP